MKTIQNTFLVFLLATSIAGAQDKNNAVKLGFQSIYGGDFFTGSYERVLSERTSLQLALGYQGYTHDGSEGNYRSSVNSPPGEIWKYRYYMILPEIRYYFGTNTAPEGFYGAPFLMHYRRMTDYKDGQEGKDNYKTLNTTYGGGLKIGYQWLIKNLVALDFNIGGGYLTMYEKEEDERARRLKDRFFLNYQLCLGVVF